MAPVNATARLPVEVFAVVEVPGLNRTPIVQEAPTARAAVQVPPDRANDPATVPVGATVTAPNVNAPPARATLPVLVTVTNLTLLVVPLSQLPKASEVGETVTVRAGTAPVPVRATGEPFTGTLDEIVAVPV